MSARVLPQPDDGTPVTHRDAAHILHLSHGADLCNMKRAVSVKGAGDRRLKTIEILLS